MKSIKHPYFVVSSSSTMSRFVDPSTTSHSNAHYCSFSKYEVASCHSTYSSCYHFFSSSSKRRHCSSSCSFLHSSKFSSKSFGRPRLKMMTTCSDHDQSMPKNFNSIISDFELDVNVLKDTHVQKGKEIQEFSSSSTSAHDAHGLDMNPSTEAWQEHFEPILEHAHGSFEHLHLIIHSETYGCAMNVADTQIVHSLLLSQLTGKNSSNSASSASFSSNASSSTTAKVPQMTNSSSLSFSPDSLTLNDVTKQSQTLENSSPRVTIEFTEDESKANVFLLNTCAIRDHAELRVIQRLKFLRALKNSKKAGQRKPVVCVLGCMAEHLKTYLLETAPDSNKKRLADIVMGPDSYRHLPMALMAVVGSSEASASAYHIQLSAEETYAEVTPVRDVMGRDGTVSAFVNVMRGCDNACSFCVVPRTRGRERSRDLKSIVDEVKALSASGYKEVVLLGQNVNSYNDRSEFDFMNNNNNNNNNNVMKVSKGDGLSALLLEETGGKDIGPVTFSFQGDDMTMRQPDGSTTRVVEYSSDLFQARYPNKRLGRSFADLLRAVSEVDPEMRIRFTSPHPKDYPDDLISVMQSRTNICKQVHVPAQSGSSTVLNRMQRFYTRDAYLDLINKLRSSLPGVALSTDMIAGFCGETEAEHLESLSLLKEATFEQAFLYYYSERSGTPAAAHLKDDVPLLVKKKRLRELLDLFHLEAKLKNERDEIGRVHLVLVEGAAMKMDGYMTGRTDTNKRVVFPKTLMRSSGMDKRIETGRRSGRSDLFGSGMANKAFVESGERIHVGEYVEVLIQEVSSLTLTGVAIRKSSIADFFSSVY